MFKSPKSAWPIGCDLHDHSVRVVQYDKTGGQVTVQTDSCELTDRKVNPQQWADQVGGFLKRIAQDGRWKGSRCVLGVQQPLLWTRTLDMVEMPDQELHNAIEWQLSRDLGMNRDAFTCDHYVVGVNQQDDKTRLEILAMGINREGLNERVELFENAGLDVVAVDAAPAAAARAAWHALGNAKACIVDISDDATCLTITDNGEPRFIRVLKHGCQQIDATIVQRLSVSHDQARCLRRGVSARGLTPPNNDEQDNSETLEQIRMMTGMELAREIEISQQFYNRRYRTGQMDQLLVCGQAASDPALLETIGSQVKMEVKVIDRLPGGGWDSVHTSNFSVGEWVTAAGLSLYDQPQKPMRDVA